MASVPQREQLASTPKQSLQLRKEQSRQFRVPNREGERVKVSENRTLTRKKEMKERDHGEERVDSTVNEGRFQGGKGGQAKRAFL